MITLIVVLWCIAANLLVGILVWATIDYPDGRYLKWMDSGPSAVLKILAVMLWPIGLGAHLWRKCRPS